MFSQVGVGNSELQKQHGIRFSKIMGHGGFGGFSIWPNFKRYSFLIVWESKSKAESFFKSSMYFKQWKERSKDWFTFVLRPIKSHGKWSGKNPFDAGEEDENLPIAVLTRARIRWQKLWVFWRNVPSVYRQMKRFPGLLFANGIGEYPIFQQATISIWENKEAMMEFAYKDERHARIVQRTRSENWYSEELFGRFNVVGYFSNHRGDFDRLCSKFSASDLPA